MSSVRVGVGLLGAGPVSQAIHVPALAALPDEFSVVHVMDVDAAVGRAVADRCGARFSPTVEAVLEDPAVEVVAVCSPNAVHAEQAIAAFRAGKRLIMCEKPLATTRADAEAIAAEAERTGIPLLVGTMHVYDPAWRAALDLWRQAGERARLIQSAIYLPVNDIFIDQATDQVVPPLPFSMPGDPADPAHQSSVVRAAMLSLAIHNIPLLRQIQPEVGEVTDARMLPPYGYSLGARHDGCTMEMTGFLPGRWPPSWTMRVLGESHELRLRFPPSYVLAGSATAEIRTSEGTQTLQFETGGYRGLWRHAADVLAGKAEPPTSPAELVADLDYAMTLADGAERIFTGGV